MSALLYNRLMRYSRSQKNLSTSSVCCRTNLLPEASLPSFHLHGKFLLLPKHKRQEFSVAVLIGTLDVEEKARAKDTHARVAEGASSAHMVQKRTSRPTSSKITRTKLRAKASLIQRTSRHILPTSRRILIRRGRDFAMSAVILITRLRSVLTAMRSANMRRAASPLMLSSVILI